MAVKISDISGYTKFINTKFVDDIKPVEEPTIDAQAVMGAYTEEQRKEASEKWHEAHEAMLAAQKAAMEAAKIAADAAAAKAAFEATAAASTHIGSDECPPGYVYNIKTGDCVQVPKGLSGLHKGKYVGLGGLGGEGEETAPESKEEKEAKEAVLKSWAKQAETSSALCPPGFIYNAQTAECVEAPNGGKKESYKTEMGFKNTPKKKKKKKKMKFVPWGQKKK